MATLVITNGKLVIGGTDVSNSVQSMELKYEAEVKDDTTMGDDTRSNKPGLKNWSLSVTFLNDYASSALEANIWSLIGTSFAFEMRPVNTTVSANNPKYTSYGTITDTTVVGGNVGDMVTKPITIVPCKGSNSATLVRATS